MEEMNIDERVGRKEPGCILTQVTIISNGYKTSLAAGKHLCAEIVKILNDTTAYARNELVLNYDLRRLDAVAIPRQPLKFTLKLLPRLQLGGLRGRSHQNYQKIHTDVISQELALIIKQYSQISDVIFPYSFQIQFEGQEISGGKFSKVLIYSRRAHELTGVKNYDLLSLRKRKAMEANTSALYRRAVHKMEYSYDPWMSLREEKGSGYKSTFDLADDDGMPLTQNKKDSNLEDKNAVDITHENENILAFNSIQGRDYYEICENFLESDITRLESKLNPKKLLQLKTENRDVQQYIIDTLENMRDATIKQILLALGSSPVLEASDDALPAAGIQPASGAALQASGGAMGPSQPGSNFFTAIRTPTSQSCPSQREYRIRSGVQQEEGRDAFAIGES